jgi:hypothetical protein
MGASSDRLSADEFMELSLNIWDVLLNMPAKAGRQGLTLSTLQLNLGAFCVSGGAVRGCFGGV